MKKFYFVLYEDIIKEVGDLTQAVVLCKILNYAQTNHTATPAFQQSYLAAILSLSTDTVGRILKELKSKGFVDYCANGYGTYRTTHYSITDKTRCIINGDKPAPSPQQPTEEDILKKIASAESPVAAKKIASEHGLELTSERVEKIGQFRKFNHNNNKL